MPIPPSGACAETRSGSEIVEFATMVARGLSLPQKQMEPRFFYDALGSALFDAITRLPEYTITRAEMNLLNLHGPEILSVLGGKPQLVELGPGNGEKLECLLADGGDGMRVHLVDISTAALDCATKRLGERSNVEVSSFAGTFLQGLASLTESENRRLVLFLGSNLGNFAPQQSSAFLRSVRNCLSPGDGLLLGLDLVKGECALTAAYDDPLGVTAAFNKNLLSRINRELGATFDLAGFDHRAVWNSAAGRVEMHLVSVVDQVVSIPETRQQVSFQAGETIWTESSHKYDPKDVELFVRRAGFGIHAMWLHKEYQFLEILCVV